MGYWLIVYELKGDKLQRVFDVPMEKISHFSKTRYENFFGKGT